MPGEPTRPDRQIQTPPEPPLGRPTLALLRRLRSVAILRQLEAETLRPHELERRLPGLSHAALMRRLAELARAGAIRRERTRDTPPHAYYAIGPHGRAILAIAAEACAWEERRRAAGRPPGLRALRALGDEPTLAILRELGMEVLGPRALGRRLRSQRPIPHASLMRRLSALAEQELLLRSGDPPGSRYELTGDARQLARLVVMSMRAERHRLGRDAAEPANDLLAMLRVLAPTLAIPAELSGTFALHLAGGREVGGALYLEAGGGALTIRGGPPAAGLSGFMLATLDTWLRSLGGSPAPGLAAAGDVPALEAILRALSAPLARSSPARVSHS